MTIQVVQSKKEWRLFHRVLKTVYRNNANYIFPLENEVEQVFSTTKNAAFSTENAQCWVLTNNRGEAIGRISAFIDFRHQEEGEVLGGIGFFECIDDFAAATMLFETAEAFLLEKGVTVVEAPVNLGERDRFWGLLVKGQENTPLYQENYHPTYYADMFEQLGYQPFEQVLTYKGYSRDIPFQRLSAIAKRLRKQHPVEVKALDFNNMDEFANGFCEVYNAAFEEYAHFKAINPEQIKAFMVAAKAVVDPQLACIAYYEGKPAGFIALYPDINPFLKSAKGKLNWMTIPGFLIKKNLASSFNVKGMGFGIHPAYRSKGIFAFLVDYLGQVTSLDKYPQMFLAGIRAHNNEIRSIYDKLNVKVDRVHLTLRKPLEEGVTIEPFAMDEL